jgi:thioredoxin 1
MEGFAALALALSLAACPAFSAQKPSEDSPAAVTVLFFTASWCGPCRAVHKVLDNAVRKHGSRIRVVTVDFDTDAAETQRWDVHEIPVAIVLENGRLALRAQGASRETLQALERALDAAVARAPAKKRGAL